MLATQPQFTPDHQQIIYTNKIHNISRYNRASIAPQALPNQLGCTMILTTSFSDYATFMRTLRQRGLIGDHYRLIELKHVKKRLAYIHELDLMVAQLDDLSELQYMNPCPSTILLTGTARCFNVKQAPCDTIVVADLVWDKEEDVYYTCPHFQEWVDPKAVHLQVGGYFSDKNLQNIRRMQDDPIQWRDLVAYDEVSCSFTQMCNSFGWEWAIVKTVTNDICIPNTHMREHAAQLAADYVIDLIGQRNKI